MREVLSTELALISGGEEDTFLLTHKISTDGISSSCINNYISLINNTTISDNLLIFKLNQACKPQEQQLIEDRLQNSIPLSIQYI